MHCTVTFMKTAAIPTVHFPSELRQAAEDLLTDGKTLPGFVEDVVRRNATYRRAPNEVVARGLASRDAARAFGGYVEAVVVLDKLARGSNSARNKVAPAK